MKLPIIHKLLKFHIAALGPKKLKTRHNRKMKAQRLDYTTVHFVCAVGVANKRCIQQQKRSANGPPTVRVQWSQRQME